MYSNTYGGNCCFQNSASPEEGRRKIAICWGICFILLLIPGIVLVSVGQSECQYVDCCPTNTVCSSTRSGNDNYYYDYFGPCGGGNTDDDVLGTCHTNCGSSTSVVCLQQTYVCTSDAYYSSQCVAPDQCCTNATANALIEVGTFLIIFYVFITLSTCCCYCRYGSNYNNGSNQPVGQTMVQYGGTTTVVGNAGVYPVIQQYGQAQPGVVMYGGKNQPQMQYAQAPVGYVQYGTAQPQAQYPQPQVQYAVQPQPVGYVQYVAGQQPQPQPQVQVAPPPAYEQPVASAPMVMVEAVRVSNGSMNKNC